VSFYFLQALQYFFGDISLPLACYIPADQSVEMAEKQESRCVGQEEGPTHGESSTNDGARENP
jgi:hypothetical protein